MLVGEVVGGRGALVAELARRIAAGESPEALRGKQIYSLDLDALQARAGTPDAVAIRFQSLVSDMR